jgi:hypothetical protein
MRPGDGVGTRGVAGCTATLVREVDGSGEGPSSPANAKGSSDSIRTDVEAIRWMLESLMTGSRSELQAAAQAPSRERRHDRCSRASIARLSNINHLAGTAAERTQAYGSFERSASVNIHRHARRRHRAKSSSRCRAQIRSAIKPQPREMPAFEPLDLSVHHLGSGRIPSDFHSRHVFIANSLLIR